MDKKSSVQRWDSFWGDNKHLRIQLAKGYHQKIVETISGLFKNNLKGKKILEIGAGSCVDSIELAKRGANVYVVDYSKNALKIGRQLACKENVKINFIFADAYNLPIKNGFFDCVFHVGFLEHFENETPLLEEQKRILKKNGFLVVDVPQKYSLATLVKHILIFFDKWYAGWERQYSINELKNLLKKNGFKIIGSYARDYYPMFLTGIRHLHRLAIGYKGKEAFIPLLPGMIGKAYNGFFNLIEKTFLGYYVCWCIGVVAKPGSLNKLNYLFI